MAAVQGNVEWGNRWTCGVTEKLFTGCINDLVSPKLRWRAWKDPVSPREPIVSPEASWFSRQEWATFVLMFCLTTPWKLLSMLQVFRQRVCFSILSAVCLIIYIMEDCGLLGIPYNFPGNTGGGLGFSDRGRQPRMIILVYLNEWKPSIDF